MRQKGLLFSQLTGDKMADVEYVLQPRPRSRRGPCGQIFIGDDPHPAARFMTFHRRGVPDHYVLHTAAGDRLPVQFLSSQGQFSRV